MASAVTFTAAFGTTPPPVSTTRPSDLPRLSVRCGDEDAGAQEEGQTYVKKKSRVRLPIHEYSNLGMMFLREQAMLTPVSVHLLKFWENDPRKY